MSSNQAVYEEWVSQTQDDLTATGDIVGPAFAQPVDIIRWGVILDALLDVGAGFSAALDRRITIGSDIGRVNAAGGTLTRTADVAAGQVLYGDVSAGTPNAPLELDPGDEVVFEVTDAADTAGTGHWFCMWRRRPFVDPRLTIGGASTVTKVTLT